MFLSKTEKPIILQTGCTQEEKRLFAVYPPHYRIFELLRKTAETQNTKSIHTALEFMFDIFWNLSQNAKEQYVSDDFRDSYLMLKKAFVQNRLNNACRIISDMFLTRNVLNKSGCYSSRTAPFRRRASSNRKSESGVSSIDAAFSYAFH